MKFDNMNQFFYQNGFLSCESVPLHKIARSLGTPVFVYSKQALFDSFKKLQTGLRSVPHMICFAAKANSNIEILRILKNAGAGVDIVSGGELFRAQKAGVSAKKIIFSGVGKTAHEIRAAMSYQKNGIFSFNVESPAELEHLNQIATERKQTVSVALRFNPNIAAKTHPYIATGLKKGKFGILKPQLIQLLRQAKKYPWIQFNGISLHIGSQILSLSPLNQAFKELGILIHEANKILPNPLRFVDLGGGIGIRYVDEIPPSPQRYCALILKHFGIHSPFKGKLLIVLEPGRSIVGNAGVLLTKILYRKQTGLKKFLIVDAAMNDLPRRALYQSIHSIIPVKKSHITGDSDQFDIVGPVCESADRFVTDWRLPKGLKNDDLLAVLSAGAYSFSMSSNYNSRPRAAEVLIDKKRFRVIRSRETYQDLIRGEKIF